MSDSAHPQLATSLPDFAASLAQVGSDTTGQFCEPTHALASMIAEWNGEIAQFLMHRLQRNGEAMLGTTKCQSLPEIFALQGQWFQHAADDYLEQASKLMELNSRFMQRTFESVGQHQTQGPAVPRDAPVSAPRGPREHRVSEAA